MSQATPLLTLQSDCQTTITLINRKMANLGYRVVRSFDLQSACASYPDQVCPHHGEAPCDCQLVVLLVYGPEAKPASLVIHSHRGQSEVALVDSPGDRSSPDMDASIRLALTEENFLSVSQEVYTHVSHGQAR